MSKYFHRAGWSSLVARQAHNLKVVGSNPTPATTLRPSEFQCVLRVKSGVFAATASEIASRCDDLKRLRQNSCGLVHDSPTTR